MKTKIMIIILTTLFSLNAYAAKKADTLILHKWKSGTFAVSVITGKTMTTVMLNHKHLGEIKTHLDYPASRHESPNRLNGTTVNGMFVSESFFDNVGKINLFAKAGGSRISFTGYKKYLADKTIVRKGTPAETKEFNTKELLIVYHDFGTKTDLKNWFIACVIQATSLADIK